MKRRFLSLVFAVLFIGLLNACTVDKNFDKRPELNSDERWVSIEPDFWFEMVNEEKGGAYGELHIDNRIIAVNVFFDYGSKIFFVEYEKDPTIRKYLLRAKCTFGENELVISIDEDFQGIFNGQVKKIVFIREDISENFDGGEDVAAEDK